MKLAKIALSMAALAALGGCVAVPVGGGYYELQFNSGYLRMSLIDDAGKALQVRSTTLVNDDAWHFVTATYNGNSDASGINMYVDGVLGNNILTNVALTGSLLNNANVRIGTWGGNSLYFPGLISDVQIYNRALSSTEVSQIKSAPASVTNVPPTLPRCVSIRPAPRRIASALRRVTGEMPRSSARRVSAGRRSPARRSPIPIACRGDSYWSSGGCWPSRTT